MDAQNRPAVLHLDVELKAHRSLSRKGAMLLMVPVAAVNLLFAVVFLVLKAPIVPPFLGLDVIALAAALAVSFRAAKAVERVQVSADRIEVRRIRGRRDELVWTSPTGFTRVEMAEDARQDLRVRLWCKGRGVVLAQALGPRERKAFGRRLQSAVQRARNERWV